MHEFQQRLEKAIERGRRIGTARSEAEHQRALSQQEMQRLHSQYRLALSDHIEQCLRQLVDRFPGFRYETVVDDRGWGAAIGRDDVRLKSRREARTCFSRLELVIRPLSSYNVLELSGKAAVCNKELFNRAHYRPLAEVDPAGFAEMIDNWAVEFAESYAVGS